MLVSNRVPRAPQQKGARPRLSAIVFRHRQRLPHPPRGFRKDLSRHAGERLAVLQFDPPRGIRTHCVGLPANRLESRASELEIVGMPDVDSLVDVDSLESELSVGARLDGSTPVGASRAAMRKAPERQECSCKRISGAGIRLNRSIHDRGRFQQRLRSCALLSCSSQEHTMSRGHGRRGWRSPRSAELSHRFEVR